MFEKWAISIFDMMCYANFLILVLQVLLYLMQFIQLKSEVSILHSEALRLDSAQEGQMTHVTVFAKMAIGPTGCTSFETVEIFYLNSVPSKAEFILY